MKLTDLECDLANQIGERCKEYNFFVIQNGDMYFDKESPKRLTTNHLKCMLRTDLAHKFPIAKKRFERVLDCSIKALIIMTQEQIKKQLSRCQ